jgi:DNA-binding transcriptional MerR regulator
MDKKFISSKEILEISGISRATLNNYIKMGIIPKPVVQRPMEGLEGVKQIGYFPQSVLDRLETVQRLKKEGHSMEDIANRFQNLPSPEDGRLPDSGFDSEVEEDVFNHFSNASPFFFPHQSLILTFEEVTNPAYLMNYDFQIAWINSEAEKHIFKQRISAFEDMGSRNVFNILFNWEFHEYLENWRDLIALHMSFVKIKYARSWMENLYEGISRSEIHLLQKIYDEVPAAKKQSIKDTEINLRLKDGSSRPYQAYSIFFREGILFIYVQSDST